MTTTTSPETPLSGWQVLVTRPAGDADALMARLPELGASAVHAPLMVIAPLPPPDEEAGIIADLDRIDFVIVTSRNAVRHGMPRLADRWPQWPVGQQWIAIGRATARALDAFGIRAGTPADERSEGLLALPALQDVAGRRILLLSGEGGRGMIEQSFAARGVHVTRLDVYRRNANPEAAPLVDDFLLRPPPRAALVSSGEALHNLLALAPALVHGDSWLVVPVARVAASARALGARRILVAGRADDESMLATLVDMAICSSREDRS